MREFATTQRAVQVSKRPGRRQLGRVEAWRQVGGNVAGKSTRKYGKSRGKTPGKTMGKSMGKSTMNGSFRGKFIERNGGNVLASLVWLPKGPLAMPWGSKIQGIVSPRKNSLHAQPVFRQQSLVQNKRGSRQDRPALHINYLASPFSSKDERFSNKIYINFGPQPFWIHLGEAILVEKHWQRDIS